MSAVSVLTPKKILHCNTIHGQTCFNGRANYRLAILGPSPSSHELKFCWKNPQTYCQLSYNEQHHRPNMKQSVAALWPNQSILTLLHSVSISRSLLFLSLPPFAGPLPSPFSCHALFPLSYLVAAKSAAFHFSFSCFWNSICTHSSCINERVCAVVYKLEPWNARCIIRHRPSKKI